MEQVIIYFAAAWLMVMAVLFIIQLKANKPDPDTAEKWRTDPNNWKMGLFYYNKADHRVFPPKQEKYMGWTINFGNPVSVAALIVCIAAFLFFVVRFL